jgi:hypothetical protein
MLHAGVQVDGSSISLVLLPVLLCCYALHALIRGIYSLWSIGLGG